ncbi:MAG TPA: hypothetical protein VII45_03930 [Solirubrobacterales bacterium]
MDENDTASIVLTPPEKVIERFCDASLGGDLVDWAGTRAGDGLTVSRGFCGYLGGSGLGFDCGYDEGYDFMADLMDRGWEALDAKGNWPLVVYLKWRPRRPAERPAIAMYCEGDLTVWVFDSPEIARRHYAALPDAT